MKALLLFSFVICLFASTHATYVRVINAVPGTQVLDVYYNVPNSNEKIRFFQDLNSTDVPPYFFIAVPSGNSSVSFTFLFKDTADYFGAPATANQLANQPTYNASIRAGNFTYTLVVASPSQGQSNQSSSLGTYPCPYLESPPNSQNNYQFLLLNDRAQGDQPPSGVQFIRLVNLAPQATSISLVTMDAQCPQSNQTTGNQTEGQGQGSQGQQPGNQTQPSVIVNELPFLQSSDYVALPQGTSPQQLAVCYQGEKIPVVDSPMLKQSAKQFSILLFTGTQQNQTGNQTQEQNQTQVAAGGQEQNQTQSQTQGSVEGSEQNQTEAQFQVQNQSQTQSQNQTSENQGQAETQNQTQSQNQQQGSQIQQQGSQSQSQQQSQSSRQGGFLATLTDDEPDTTQNVRIRVIHAYPAVSMVTVLLDGRALASNLEFGNVTQYMMTNRGIHNITVIPSSGSQNDSQSALGSIAANPIIVFLAWRRTYTVAIVPTGVSVQSNESESSNETMGSGAIGGVSQNASEQPLPGFRSFYHQILIDQLSQNATLGQNLAYIQVVHLAPNVSAVNVSLGNYNISNLQFLQSSHYINVSTSGQTNITISQSGNVLANVVSRNLQPRTLYTIWIIGNPMESSESSGTSNVRVFVTMDRRVTIRCVLDDEE